MRNAVRAGRIVGSDLRHLVRALLQLADVERIQVEKLGRAAGLHVRRAAVVQPPRGLPSALVQQAGLLGAVKLKQQPLPPGEPAAKRRLLTVAIDETRGAPLLAAYAQHLWRLRVAASTVQRLRSRGGAHSHPGRGGRSPVLKVVCLAGTRSGKERIEDHHS